MWVQPQPLPVDPYSQTPIPYRIHTPKLTQVVTGQNFHYFKLRLFDTSKFFQTKKGWNRDYPPGQKIYSDTPSAAALRSLISAEHSILYSGRSTRDGNVEGQLGRDPQDFFALLEKGADSPSVLFSDMHSCIKNGYESLFKAATVSAITAPRTPASTGAPNFVDNLQIYTYVLMDDGLRFSRCGAGTSVDMSSKHALHAGAQPEVWYAGEFWTEPDMDPGGGCSFDGTSSTWRMKLYMDNNSGTFAPPKGDLYRMKGLMEANFPGIRIVMLDYQDKEWKLRRKGEVVEEEEQPPVNANVQEIGWVLPNWPNAR